MWMVGRTVARLRVGGREVNESGDWRRIHRCKGMSIRHIDLTNKPEMVGKTVQGVGAESLFTACRRKGRNKVEDYAMANIADIVRL